MPKDSFKNKKLMDLVNRDVLRKIPMEHGPCPFRDCCSLYQGEGVLTEKAKKDMCDYNNSGWAPRVGRVHDARQGTVCEAYIGKKVLQVMEDLTKKMNKADPFDLEGKFDLGGF